uniref:Uncharacterized protein n=1 Tax=Chromera velia CCMP2878 TaxID=1169474 RepID=A0A0G4FJB3_9ALVE|eukprot:Cvel_17334.t1-p1 / transcript=Cvel_17334.t1 / gene=Cvel_17334 / organism=Chromera_velia_CCMP2878 / gene_product=hypothetical protein / transcript_product=hypothetical protein / location=Cvel_scaffold1377:17593-18180(-) / protein_length=196 / sequence_SO=supercontig / SO=protein_coding / is_pseudo=false
MDVKSKERRTPGGRSPRGDPLRRKETKGSRRRREGSEGGLRDEELEGEQGGRLEEEEEGRLQEGDGEAFEEDRPSTRTHTGWRRKTREGTTGRSRRGSNIHEGEVPKSNLKTLEDWTSENRATDASTKGREEYKDGRSKEHKDRGGGEEGKTEDLTWSWASLKESTRPTARCGRGQAKVQERTREQRNVRYQHGDQ